MEVGSGRLFEKNREKNTCQSAKNGLAMQWRTERNVGDPLSSSTWNQNQERERPNPGMYSARGVSSLLFPLGAQASQKRVAGGACLLLEMGIRDGDGIGLDGRR